MLEIKFRAWDKWNNKMVMPPAPQDMFVLFTKPIFNQLSGKLTSYFKQYN